MTKTFCQSTEDALSIIAFINWQQPSVKAKIEETMFALLKKVLQSPFTIQELFGTVKYFETDRMDARARRSIAKTIFVFTSEALKSNGEFSGILESFKNADIYEGLLRRYHP